MGPKCQNPTFSEQCHVAYQVKGNHECSNCPKYFACRTPLTLGVGIKGQNSFFSEHGHVAYQIKGIMNAAPPLSDPGEWDIG